jgi:hypothetical protein
MGDMKKRGCQEQLKECFVKIVAVIDFKGGALGTLVMRYPLNREGLKEMCSDIYVAMKCGAHSVSIADGYVEVDLPELAVWLDLSPSEITDRIVRILYDTTIDKKEFVKFVRAAIDLMIGSTASEQSVA